MAKRSECKFSHIFILGSCLLHTLVTVTWRKNQWDSCDRKLAGPTVGLDMVAKRNLHPLLGIEP
jgi:hypothetical protein